uniref:Uncharacterized protein n=1 Tax=Meloidogyne floridensis TaxID=298350 RepID=A0A915NMW6_9BILA
MKLILKQRKQIPIELLFEIIKFVNGYPIEVLDQMDFIERKFVFYVILLCLPFIIIMLPSILAIIVISFCIGLFFSIPFCVMALYLSFLNYFNEIIIELLTTTQRYINNFLDTRRARLEEIQLAQTDWSGIDWLLQIGRR